MLRRFVAHVPRAGTGARRATEPAPGAHAGWLAGSRGCRSARKSVPCWKADIGQSAPDSPALPGGALEAGLSSVAFSGFVYYDTPSLVVQWRRLTVASAAKD